jgi:hypothetical protein
MHLFSHMYAHTTNCGQNVVDTYGFTADCGKVFWLWRTAESPYLHDDCSQDSKHALKVTQMSSAFAYFLKVSK